MEQQTPSVYHLVLPAKSAEGKDTWCGLTYQEVKDRGEGITYVRTPKDVECAECCSRFDTWYESLRNT